MRVQVLCLSLVIGSLMLCPVLCPAKAAPSLKILAKHTQAKTHGINETCYSIGIVNQQKAGTSLSSTKPVKVVVWGPTHPGAFAPMPAVYVNRDASLMAIQFMPDWGKRGRRGFGRRIYLIVATADQRIRILKDFSVRLNRLSLANASRWQNVSGHFHRPASDIFMGGIEGRRIYVNQYTPDPKVGLPEYITICAEVSRAGNLTFLSETSQGF